MHKGSSLVSGRLLRVYHGHGGFYSGVAVSHVEEGEVSPKDLRENQNQRHRGSIFLVYHRTSTGVSTSRALDLKISREPSSIRGMTSISSGALDPVMRFRSRELLQEDQSSCAASEQNLTAS